jgi:signal transduction histidine kinase
MEKFSSLGRIAAMIAHEIKNPLTNINLATMQLSEELSLDTNIFLSIIKRNSEKINTQINNFLNVTAFTELHIRNISINELLDEALKEAEDRIALEEVKVVKDYSNDICNVAIDTEKMKIAFLNIIFNAIDSMETEKGILSIKTEGKNNKCVITISDNGSGMKKETLSQIFEPFYTTKPKKGSGLGLSQTQNIILNHNGNIDVESQPGQGTSFIITLNFVEDQAVVSALHKE